jgi:hypothetical protein
VARSLRSPAVLMTVYVAVFIWGGPWDGPGGTGGRNLSQIVIAVLLAVLAARGSRRARVLMITYSILGAFAVSYSSTYWGASEPLAATFLTLTCALVQVGLLVSTPMYQRTRPGGSRGQFQVDQLLPWPKLWVVLASASCGLVMTLLPFSDGPRETVCSAGGGSLAACSASGFGYPIAYRFAYNNLAPRGILPGAFATDFALWSLIILLVLYLLQVSRSRENSDPGAQLVIEPVPARP